jgi:glycosyltransferase involved in cell wall biosynthesis
MRDGRVIIVSDYVGGEGAATGGAGHAVLASYRALRSAGVDVRVIAGFGPVPGGNMGDEPGRFVSLGGTDLREGGGTGTLRAIYNSAARTALAAALADEDRARTVIILHQWTRYLSPAAMRAFAGFRLMIYMHDYFWACPNGAYYDFQEQRPCTRRPMGSECLSANCDRQGRVHKLGRVARQAALLAAKPGALGDRLCLHLSEQAKATIAPLLPAEQHAVIHNSEGIPAEAPAPAQGASYDVGYFGRLEPEKGVAALIETVDHSGLTGLLVGQGALKGIASKRQAITHRAWQPREAMAAAMRSCRVVVLPSLWRETWGLIIPEAMAAGVPVLVSVRAGSAELVERFGGGATFDPGIPGDLEAKLGDLLRTDARDLEVRDWAGFREFLSARTHAGRIAALAAQTWGIDLCPTAGVSAAPRPAGSAFQLA